MGGGVMQLLLALSIIAAICFGTTLTDERRDIRIKGAYDEMSRMTDKSSSSSVSLQVDDYTNDLRHYTDENGELQRTEFNTHNETSVLTTASAREDGDLTSFLNPRIWGKLMKRRPATQLVAFSTHLFIPENLASSCFSAVSYVPVKLDAKPLLWYLGKGAQQIQGGGSPGRKNTAPLPHAPSKLVPATNTLPLGCEGKKTGTYLYQQNAEGWARVLKANVVIEKSDLRLAGDKDGATTACTREYCQGLIDVRFWEKKKAMDAGHIVSRRFGGPGNQPINLFPQAPRINRGAFNKFEGEIYECLLTGGAEKAQLSWEFNYSTDWSTTPAEVVYTVKYKGGVCDNKTVKRNFTNEVEKKKEEKKKL